MPQSLSQTTLPPGTVITKRYRIERLIGTGGYASVYRATDMTLGYERAIKEVADPDPGVRTQFRLEAELLINSKHPNIPHGYHLIEDMGRLFLVMDYIHGKDLEELLNESLTQHQRALDEAQVLTWAIDICGALEKMHTLKVPVIHRDIKPANIKITPENQPILIDFGLAKLQQKGATLTAAQGVSPGFAPPEQYMAKGRTDPRTDIYGLGATLYACLTGKDPPEAPGRLLAQTGAGGSAGMQLVPPRKLNPHISEQTDRLIVRALELSPTQRQQSAHEFEEEMQLSLRRLNGASAAASSPSNNGEATMVMGVLCPRCGTQNRPDAARCAECGMSLRGYELPLRPTGQHPAAGAEASGKQARVLPPAGNRTSVKTPAVGANRAQAAQINGERGGRAAQMPGASSSWTGQQGALNSGKRPAVGAGRSGKQPELRTVKQAAVALESSSGKHRAISASSGAGALALPATRAQATAVAPAVLPNKSAKAGASPARAGALQPEVASEHDGAWIRLGTTALNGFDKVMFALAGIEVLWGAMILVLGIVALVYRSNTPVLQLIVGWAIVVLLVSFLGAQTLSRPMYRRAKMTNTRRWLQGAFILLYSVVVQAAGIWGAMVFHSANPGGSSLPLAEFAYVIFGISAFIAGIFGISTVLG